jgi:hypothetical protein
MNATKTLEIRRPAADELAALAQQLAAATEAQTRLRTERQRSDAALNPTRFGTGRDASPTAREVLEAHARRPALEADVAAADLAVDEATQAYEAAFDRAQRAAGEVSREAAKVLLAEAADLAEHLEAVNAQLDALFYSSGANGRYRLPALRVPMNLESWRHALRAEGLLP